MIAEQRITLSIRPTLLVVEKNLKVYASKPPVLIFGVLFPLFLFLAFFLGRPLDFTVLFPGLFAMSLFFLATSIGPLITPWEKTTKTYERLLALPVTIRNIVAGDILTGMIYGTVLSGLILAAGLLCLEYQVRILPLAAGILGGGFCFASLGALFASPPVPNASYTMIMSSLVRFPLVFISGIFIPLQELSVPARILSCISPISYLVDLMNYSLRGHSILPPLLDISVMLGFGLLICVAAHRMQRRNMIRGL
jgi:ABC-2 type transport system permease protein